MTPGVNAPKLAGPPTERLSVAGTVPVTVPSSRSPPVAVASALAPPTTGSETAAAGDVERHLRARRRADGVLAVAREHHQAEPAAGGHDDVLRLEVEAAGGRTMPGVTGSVVQSSCGSRGRSSRA